MRVHRENKYFFTSEDWIEGKTIKVNRCEAYSRGTTRTYRRKVKYNRSDGLYFLLDNRKYFEYEFKPC